jgi:hypothetical protein
MKETIYEGRTQSEKIELLKANCLHSEFQQVKIFFSEDDLNEMKSRLSEHCISKSGYEDELKDVGKDLRNKIKEQNETIRMLLQFLKDKFEYQTQEVFDFDDQENGMMLTYNVQGELISSRKLRPQERQTKIFNLNNKTA